ncbi:T9SS type A sorting domain-containing protein [Adhaeribacter sp. BT258]|uniref:T9SS type A sorting domain-containing protein n=1 Tax=Adhaeribacter terrigena TaxID=2793070 RepID=A0ABS1C1K5_9BACT|nr:T9SS type A sorting domain-containing protein [Adhaeribacter terrigena]MBK0403284.1 T9SS type A sorting domain-containing protein [Adhaeribacter terrigena]
MKKLLFLGLAFSASVGVSSAQKARQIVDKAGPAALIKADRNGNTGTSGNSVAKERPASNQKTNVKGNIGTKIGKTWYDLPSNSSVPNRTLRHSDGTVSAVWTETCNGPTGDTYPNRGVGYNYFDGTTWKEGPTTRAGEFQGTCGYPASQSNFGIASKRVGWPEIISINGNEMVFTHAEGISVTQRPAKGATGITTWSQTTDLAFTKNIGGVTGNNGTWPRVVADGNNIHMIYTINNTPLPVINGVSGLVVYSRSTDGGVTWDKQNIQLPGLTYANGYDRIGGDAYAIAVKGSTVAIVTGSAGDPWTLWKSTNNGDTFTRKVMLSVVPADTVGNTIISPNNAGSLDTFYTAFTNDNGHALVIDNNNNVHAFAGEIRVAVRDTLGSLRPVSNGTWFPNSGAGILHWTDKQGAPTTPTLIAELEEPRKPVSWVFPTGKNGGGIAPYGQVGLLSMPNAAVNAAGDVYLVYAGVMVGTSHTSDSTGQPFRDLYLTKFTASSNSWIATDKVTNIARKLNPFGDSTSTAEQLEENVFPSVHHFVGTDGLLHTTWMSDDKPGMTLGRDLDPEKENSIMYMAFEVEKLLGTKKKDMTAFVNEIKAYPNPTSGKIAINVDLKKSANVKVRVTNIMGQEVATVEAGKLVTGKNTVSVDMSNFANGVYLYTVSSEDFTVTNRIVKQ